MDCNKIEYLERTFDLIALERTGFLVKGMTYSEIESRICIFFGLQNIYAYDFIMDDKFGVLVIADLGWFSIN